MDEAVSPDVGWHEPCDQKPNEKGERPKVAMATLFRRSAAELPNAFRWFRVSSGLNTEFGQHLAPPDTSNPYRSAIEIPR